MLTSMKQMDMRPRLRGDGVPDDEARRQMMDQMQQQQRQNQTEVAQLLGDAKLTEWQQYQSSLGARAGASVPLHARKLRRAAA